jgi:hypothetical protein
MLVHGIGSILLHSDPHHDRPLDVLFYEKALKRQLNLSRLILNVDASVKMPPHHLLLQVALQELHAHPLRHLHQTEWRKDRL